MAAELMLLTDSGATFVDCAASSNKAEHRPGAFELSKMLSKRPVGQWLKL